MRHLIMVTSLVAQALGATTGIAQSIPVDSGKQVQAASRAGQPPLAVPGAFVRVTHSAVCCSSPLIGDLVSVDVDSLTIAPKMRSVSTASATLAKTSIVSLDVRRRVGSHKGVGALVGLLVGTVGGAVAGYSTACSHCDGDYRPVGALFGGVGGLFLGMIAGAIVGYTQPRYEWTPGRVANDTR
jgi:hypothetical protein